MERMVTPEVLRRLAIMERSEEFQSIAYDSSDTEIYCTYYPMEG